MPTTKTRIKINLTETELAKVNRQAQKAGLSVSNYFRKLAGLEPLKHGGKREAKK